MNVNNMLEAYRTKKKDNSLTHGNAINVVHKYAYQRNSQRANELYTEAYQRSTSLDGTYRTAEETDNFYDGLINRYDSSNSAVLTSTVNKLNELRNSEKKFYSQFADPKSYYSSYAFSSYSDKSDDEIQQEMDRLTNLGYTNIRNEGSLEGLAALQQKRKNDAIKSMSQEEIEKKLADLDMQANAYNDLNSDGTAGVKNTSFSNPYSMIALAESSPAMGGLTAKEADELEAQSQAAKEEAFTIRYLTDETFKANVDAQISRKQELQNWWDNMEWYEQVGTWLGNSVQKGLSDASKGIFQTVNFVSDALTFGNAQVENYINRGYETFYDALGANDQNYDDFITGMDNEFLAGLSNMTTGVVQSLPSTVLVFMSGGSSAVASGLLSGAQAATTSQVLTGAFSSAAKNPSFWANVTQMLGPTYYEAIEDGASEFDAMLVALLNAGAGSLVEVGGGVETIPKGSASIKQWLKSMAEEGREEVIQGAIEASLGSLYKDVPIFSTDGSGIIDPNRAAQEFVGGVYGGALLGSGPMLINKLGGNAGGVDSQPESYLNNPVDYYEQQEIYDEALKNFQTYATPEDYYTSYSGGKATSIDENGNATSYDTNNYARGLWDGAEEFSESFGQPADVRYQLKGVNENGIEVYETSENTKNLSLSEKKKALVNSVKNDFKGRTAKFTKDGETYYAQINDAGIRKSAYGDKKSSRSGRTAKLNIGVDGNYFELLENSRYDGSLDEQGKTTNSGIHDKTSLWDYYVKTIQSDGKLYDVLINVADAGNNQYVYDVTLKENKKGRLTPKGQQGPFQTGISPTAYTIPQNSGGVNSFAQKSTENSYFKSNPNIDTAKISEAVRSNSDSTAETQLAAAAQAIGYSPELSDYMQKTYEFSPNKDVEAFADNYNRIYLLARSGYLTESEANSWGGIVANIGFPAVNSAYNQGRLAYEADMKANDAKNEAAKIGQGKQKGGAKDTTGKADKSTVSALKQVGKKTGIKFRIVRKIDGRSNANGYYDSAKGEIVLNINSKNIVATAVHELTHYIRINSPGQYKELQDFVMNWVKSKNSDFLTAVLDEYKETYGSLDNMQDVIEEITADVSSELVRNEDFLAALVTNVQFVDDICAKKPTLAQKIFDFLEDLVESVKAFVKAHGSVSDMAAALAKDDNYQTLAKLEKLWSKALDSADENYLANESTAEGKGSVKYSLGENNPGIRFSLSSPIEYTKDLVAVHNLNETSLKEALALGGLPSPSIAIIKSEQGHEKYGDITAVFGRETIDPEFDKRNKVYGADAWTPTKPTVEYKVNYDNLLAFEKDIKELSDNIANGMFSSSSVLRSYGIDETSSDNLSSLAERLTNSEAVRAAYISDTGKTIEPVYTPKEYDNFGNDAIRKYISLVGEKHLASVIAELEADESLTKISEREKPAIKSILREILEERFSRILNRDPSKKEERLNNMVENRIESIYRIEDFLKHAWEFYLNGEQVSNEIDRIATRDKLFDETDTKEVKAWLEKRLEGVIGEAGIYNGKERYTSSGNSRSFEQLHYSYTLENIVKAMNETQSARGEAMLGADAASIQAVATPSYKSVSEIKQDSGRLKHLDDTEYKKLNEELDGDIQNAIKLVRRTNKPHSDNEFVEVEIIGTVMVYAAQTNQSIQSIKKTFSKEGYTISDATAKAIQNIYKKASSMPTGYFEAKPQRAVGFDEVKYIILPEATDSKLVSELENNGVTVIRYDPATQNRVEILDKLEDVKFSLTSTSKVDYEALLAENAELRKQVETLQAEMKITEGHKVKRSEVTKLAHSMCKQYSSKYDVETLTDNLEKIFNYMAEEGSSAVEAQKALTEVAKAVIRESSEKANPIEEAYGAVELPSKIVLSENLAGSLSEAYGSYAELKQACKGGVQIKKAKDGDTVTNIDSIYQELSKKYPSLFPESRWAEEDQFDRILEVSKLNRPVYVNKYKMDEDTHAAVAASELFDRYFDTPEVKTFADKQEAKLRRLQIESRNKIKAVKEEAKQRYEKKLAELKLQKDFKYEKLKEKQAEKIADLQGLFDERRQNEKIRRETTNVRNKIKGLMKYFDGCLRNPTERKYVPAYLYDAVLDVCRMVDLETGKTSADGGPTKAAEKLRALRDQYDKMKNDRDNPYFADAYDQSLNDELLEITELVRDKTVYQLTYGELNRLYELLKRVQYNVRTATKLIGDQKATDIAESGVKVIKEIRDSSTSVSKIGGWYQINTLNAERVARKASGYIKDSELVRLVKGLSDGELKAKQAEIEAQKYFEELIGRKKEFADFKGKTKNSLVDVGLKDENGNPVLITKEMRTALYLHSLNAQNMKHITYGGLSVPDLELYKRGKKVQAFNHCVRGHISADALANIASGMTQYELDFVKAAQKFFGEFSRGKINEVSMTLYGFKKANIDNYFPINSDKNFLNTEIGISVDSTLEGSGFLNKRVNSGNPIYLEGVSDTVARHAERVSKLYGLAVPIRNFNKVYNVATQGYTTSVRESMQKKWSGDSSNPGGYVVAYFDQYIKDLQGNQRGDRLPILDKLYGNLAQSVLSLKPSISAIQLSAYPNAASVLGFKSLGKALLKGGKNSAFISRADRELIAKYTPLLEMRYDGDSTREISYASRKENWASKVPWLMAWNQKMDIAVVGRIWSAAEYWIQEHSSALKKGTDEYYKAVAEKFNEAVLHTQANYTVSQRSAVMRSQNAILKAFTIYKTESMNTFGVLVDAVSDYNAQLKRYRQSATEENKAEVRRAGKKLARSVSSVVVSSMTYTLLKFIAAALMHRMDPYRDDEDNLTAESIMSNCGRIFLEQLGGLALFGGELTSLFEAMVLQERYYGIENNQLSAISDLASSCVDMYNAFVKASDGSLTDEEKQQKLGKASWKFAQNICSILGVPLTGASQIAEGVVKHGRDMFNGEFFSFASDIELSKSDQLFEAYMNGNSSEYSRLAASYSSKSTAEGIVAKQLAEYDSRILQMAILHNDSRISKYDRIWKQMKAEGHDFDILMKAMNCAKNEINNTLKSIAEHRAKGDTSSAEYRELMLLAEEYVSMGMDDEELEKLVDEAQADIEENLAAEQVELTESAYEPKNIAGCLANGDTENAVRIYEELLEAKKTELVENGTDEDDAEEEAEAAMRSSLTSKLKPVYLELLERGNKTVLREFENILVREFGYRRSTVRKWE